MSRSWNSELKKLAAANRRAERDARKRERDLERRLKEQAKLSEMERARLEVEQYENSIEILLSLHKESSTPVDWVALASALPPHPPLATSQHEFAVLLQQTVDSTAAEKTLTAATAQASLAHARRQDQQDHAAALTTWHDETAEWRHLRALAARVLEGDLAAYEEAISEFGAFGEISSLGSAIALNFHNPQVAVCTVNVKGRHVIPAETKSLTAAGKLSVKATAKARFHEIYQDYVCSGVLRLARELFALLPVHTVLVTAAIEADTTTLTLAAGSYGIQSAPDLPVISVAFTREPFLRMNFAILDPSTAVERFPRRGDAKASRKSGEFAAIAPLTPAELDLAFDPSRRPQPQLRDFAELLASVRQLREQIGAERKPLTDSETEAEAETEIAPEAAAAQDSPELA